jgi:hypothetical protein
VPWKLPQNLCQNRRMRHITPAKLDLIEDLLADLRELDGLTETKRGIFYRGSKAFLHFHEDPAGLFADVRLDGVGFERLRVSSQKERRALLARIRRSL